MKLLKALFGKTKLPDRLPKIGEEWVVRSRDGDPWGDKRYNRLVVLDVRDGWVRLKAGAGPGSGDVRKPLRDFMLAFHPYPEDPKVTA